MESNECVVVSSQGEINCNPKGGISCNLLRLSLVHWWWLWCRIYSNEDEVVPPQGEATPPKGGYIETFFITVVNALMSILAKGRDQWGHFCIRPRGSYKEKEEIPCNFFITLVNTLIFNFMKYGDQQGRELIMVGLK